MVADRQRSTAVALGCPHTPVAVLPVESPDKLLAFVREFRPSAIVLVDDERSSADAVRQMGCGVDATPVLTPGAPNLAIFVDLESCQ